MRGTPDQRQSSRPVREARVLVRCVLALALSCVSASRALAWGPKAHRLATGWAVETLPPEIRGFFQAYRQYLIEHSNDPDEWTKKDRYEEMRHYIFLDRYGRFPYLSLPHSYKQAQQDFGAGRVARNGILPWQIGGYSLKMTNALKARNWDEVRLDAAVLGYYVADARDPLHTTENRDGQLVGQAGLAGRFGVTLIDRYANFFMVRPGDAVKIADPTEYAFQMVLDAHTWVDRVILADRRSLEGLAGYNDDYYDRFYAQIGSTVARSVSEAAHDMGSYWYTAWLNAGRPAPPGR